MVTVENLSLLPLASRDASAVSPVMLSEVSPSSPTSTVTSFVQGDRSSDDREGLSPAISVFKSGAQERSMALTQLAGRVIEVRFSA